MHPLVLFMLALIIVLVGMLLIVLSIIGRSEEIERGEKRVEGGGVIIVGPLPIVIGTSQRAALALIILALVLFVVVVATFILLARWTP
ncbi:MAG: DUF131 domain-containing protein [Desulfurococcaceae archaeon]